MKVNIYNLQREVVRDVEVDPKIFGLKPRVDIVKLVIDWQKAKQRTGTHKTKTVSEVRGTTRKPFRQKGTGNARQGSLRSVQMRGGGVVHGPIVRSHEFNLQKKVRKSGLRHALSYKLSANKLMIVDSFNIINSKTSTLRNILKSYGYSSFFCIYGQTTNLNFCLASNNLHNVVVVPQIGANVYDVIKYDCVMIEFDALTSLQARLK